MSWNRRAYNIGFFYNQERISFKDLEDIFTYEFLNDEGFEAAPKVEPNADGAVEAGAPKPDNKIKQDSNITNLIDSTKENCQISIQLNITEKKSRLYSSLKTKRFN